MPDNVVNAVKAHVTAMDELSASFDARRADLFARMTKLNEQLIALQAEQNDASNSLMSKFDAAYAKAQAADLAEDAAEREKQNAANQAAEAAQKK